MPRTFLNVLWIDDEPEAQIWERTIVQSRNWRVTEAYTAQDAMDRLTAHSFDFVIIDLIIPLDQDALAQGRVSTDVGQRILEFVRNPNRAGATPPDVRVMVLTNVISRSAHEKALRLLLPHDMPMLFKGNYEDDDFIEVVRKVCECFEQRLAAPGGSGND